MWDIPGPGFEPMSPALAGGFLSTVPQGSAQILKNIRTFLWLGLGSECLEGLTQFWFLHQFSSGPCNCTIRVWSASSLTLPFPKRRWPLLLAKLLCPDDRKGLVILWDKILFFFNSSHCGLVDQSLAKIMPLCKTRSAALPESTYQGKIFMLCSPTPPTPTLHFISTNI